MLFRSGVSWVNAKIITQYANADELVLLRYSLSMVALLIILLVLRKPLRIDFKNSVLASLGGALLFGHSIFFLKGLELGTASLGGALTPGNLCRCTGYVRIVQAVRLAAQKRGAR